MTSICGAQIWAADWIAQRLRNVSVTRSKNTCCPGWNSGGLQTDFAGSHTSMLWDESCSGSIGGIGIPRFLAENYKPINPYAECCTSSESTSIRSRVQLKVFAVR